MRNRECVPKLSPETRSEGRQALIDAAWRCAAVRGFRDLTETRPDSDQ